MISFMVLLLMNTFRGNSMWYGIENYKSQCWYRNSFLVNNPSQISRVVDGDEELNNIYDSGCHFTSLAMMIGCDPSYLASIFGGEGTYFEEDDDLGSIALDKSETYLVWDMNKPSEIDGTVCVENIWLILPMPGFYNVSLTLRHKNMDVRTYEDAFNYISEHHNNGLHIISGDSAHSVLVVGDAQGDYLVWDPDIDESKPKNEAFDMITYGKSFRSCFDKGDGLTIEIWAYELVLEQVE